ncbi:MAG TPA: hypothetical protein VKE70_02315 [Candidatus Solibacter sp.]|nr:hypothetical protein [Candidatus Solibacter sp.]
MIDTLLNLVFRCAHRRLTRPLTPVSKSEQAHTGTYVVCLDCGKHFAYDAKEMRLGRPIERPNEIAPAARNGSQPLARAARALAAVVPAFAVFFLALLGIKRDSRRR